MEDSERDEATSKPEKNKVEPKVPSLRNLLFEKRLKEDPLLQAMNAAMEAEEKGLRLEDVLTEEQLQLLSEKGIRQIGVSGDGVTKKDEDKSALDKLRFALGHWKTRKPPTA